VQSVAKAVFYLYENNLLKLMNNQFEELFEFWLDNRRFQLVVAVVVGEMAGFYLLSDMLMGILQSFDMTESAFLPLIATVVLGSLYYLSQLFHQRDLSRESGEAEDMEKVGEDSANEERQRLQEQFETLCDAVKNGDAGAVRYLKPFFLGDDPEFVGDVCDLFKSLLETEKNTKIIQEIHLVIRESQNLLSPKWPGLHSFYRSISLSSADLSELSFKEVDMVKADLRNCNLTKAEFIECELDEIDLSGSQCQETDFTVADMHHSLLESVTFVGSNFLKVDLDFSCCKNAVFENVDFEEVSFNQADLSGTVFKECRLEKTTFEGAKYDNGTVLPDGFNPEAYGMIK